MDAASAPADLTWEPTIVVSTGEAFAYGAKQGNVRHIRVPDVADFSWMTASDVIAAKPHAGAVVELVEDAIQGIATPLFLQTEMAYEVLHASAIATDAGVVCFCGASGYGKSTVAQGLALRGHALWADDLVALRVAPGRVQATVLPFRQNVRSASRSFFQTDKRDASFAPHKVTAWSTRRVHALFVLDPVDEQPHEGKSSFDVLRLRPADALAALLSHGMRLMPLDKPGERRILKDYVDLAASVPVFHVPYDQDFAILPALLDALEERVSRIDESDA